MLWYSSFNVLRFLPEKSYGKLPDSLAVSCTMPDSSWIRTFCSALLPSFMIHPSIKENNAMPIGVSKVTSINDFRCTRVRYSLWATIQVLFVLICNYLDSVPHLGVA